jgi:hypothetical protein
VRSGRSDLPCTFSGTGTPAASKMVGAMSTVETIASL